MSESHPEAHDDQIAESAADVEASPAHTDTNSAAVAETQSEPDSYQVGALLPLYRAIENAMADFNRSNDTEDAGRMLNLRLCLAHSVPTNPIDALVVTANASRAAHALYALSNERPEPPLDDTTLRQFSAEIWWGLQSLKQYFEWQAQMTVDELGLATMAGPPVAMQ